MDRHEPAPVCEPSVLEASRAIISDHLHKPPDAELGERRCVGSRPAMIRATAQSAQSSLRGAQLWSPALCCRIIAEHVEGYFCVKALLAG